MQRQIANRLVPLFRPSLISKLSVRGRRSGRWRTVPIAVLEHESKRYLVSYRGESEWARNLRASLSGRLSSSNGAEEIEVAEVPAGERAELLEVYGAKYSKMPTVASVLGALPQPDAHPIFLITASRQLARP
jgi:deazaflavin-dependent oxidoreductase (nitroreductase family)